MCRYLSLLAPFSLWMLEEMGTLEQEGARAQCLSTREEPPWPWLLEGLVGETVSWLAVEDTAEEEGAV